MSDQPLSISVKFQYDPKGQVVVTRAFLDNTPELDLLVNRERKIVLLRTLAAWPLLALVILALVHASIGDGEAKFLLTGILTTFVCILLYMSASSQARYARWRFDLFTSLYPSPTLGPVMILTIEPSGVRASYEDYAQELGWRYFTSAKRIDDFVVLAMDERIDAITIPISAFAKPDDADALVSAVESHLRASGNHAVDRIRKAIGDSDVQCSRCSYSLRGLTSDRCPECGRWFSTLAIDLMKDAQRPFWKTLMRTYPSGGPTARSSK